VTETCLEETLGGHVEPVAYVQGKPGLMEREAVAACLGLLGGLGMVGEAGSQIMRMWPPCASKLTKSPLNIKTNNFFQISVSSCQIPHHSSLKMCVCFW